MSQKAVVLLSGGLDSTTTLAIAKRADSLDEGVTQARAIQADWASRHYAADNSARSDIPSVVEPPE